MPAWVLCMSWCANLELRVTQESTSTTKVLDCSPSASAAPTRPRQPLVRAPSNAVPSGYCTWPWGGASRHVAALKMSLATCRLTYLCVCVTVAISCGGARLLGRGQRDYWAGRLQVPGGAGGRPGGAVLVHQAQGRRCRCIRQLVCAVPATH